jgi:putative tricarboxylic transport membrane protein
VKEAVSGVIATLRYPVTIVRSSLMGLVIGIVPGMGTAAANFISYGVAKQFSRKPEEFGKGAPDGIVASEACDNAVASGTLIPTLTLGIPGSATAAIVLAALYLHGIQPGPRLMANEPALVYALVWAAIVASVLILPLGILLAAPLGLVTRVRPPYLVPSVILLCLVGTYSVRNSMFDVGLMIVFGMLGFMMRRRHYPIVPLVLGLVLGPIAEENLLRALQLGRYQLGYFIESPMAKGLWVGFIAIIVYGIVKGFTHRARARSGEAASANAATSATEGR